MNTIYIDEKLFAQKKYSVKDLRIHVSFKGKGTAKFVPSTDPLRNISPHYLLCEILYCNVVLYYISDKTINTDIFNTFAWKSCDQYPNNSDKLYFLCDNATFQGISDITQR